jgi:4-hydroxy-2-oxovalerate aldolase
MGLKLADASMRDGMHSVGHQFAPADVARVAGALDGVGIDLVEVGHGDGLGGSSVQYGFSAAPDVDYVEAAAGAVGTARVAVLLLPGVGTIPLLRDAVAAGATAVRVATHCTEADIAQQHLTWAREHDLLAIGFLMMSHMSTPDALAGQAALMESYGAEIVYVVDSAGAMVPADARARVEALRERLDVAVGFHAHNNLGCGVGNALAAAEAGATWLDGSVRGLGAGAGNAATEVLAAALDRAGWTTNADVLGLMDVAEDVVAPLLARPQVIDRAALTLGYAGVYSSFLLHAERAASKYAVDPREILLELGRRGAVGGQEDMIIDVAAALAAAA